MTTKTYEGYFVLADISGYTSFLSQAELDHAHEILSELLELITEQFSPLLTVSKIEGDAVFAYVSSQRISRHEMILEVVESTYMAFRNRIQSSRRLTTCSCRGCQAMPTLDLKFMVHYGSYALQEVAGHTDLVGHDVVIAHRLLKNHVTATAGFRAYTLFTKQAFERIGIPPDGLLRQQESYEHVGSVDTFVADLHRRYDEMIAARTVCISREDAHMVLTAELGAKPVIVWDWLNNPQKRKQWSGTEARPSLRPGGRTAAGAQNHCAHGKDVFIETILDWRPFDYYTTETITPLGKVRSTYALRETDMGSALEDRTVLQPRFAVFKPLARPILKLLYMFIKADQQYRLLESAVENEQRTAVS
jgi:hypothetical protein